jgi:hypothetical protein
LDHFPCRLIGSLPEGKRSRSGHTKPQQGRNIALTQNECGFRTDMALMSTQPEKSHHSRKAGAKEKNRHQNGRPAKACRSQESKRQGRAGTQKKTGKPFSLSSDQRHCQRCKIFN